MKRGVLRRATFSMSVAILLLVAFVVAPASAAGSPKPDGWVRVGQYCNDVDGCNSNSQTAFKGKNVFNTTGKGQTAKTEYSGFADQFHATMEFVMVIENDGSSASAIKVKATGSGWKVRYEDFNGVNITTKVVQGTYKTPVLPPGASYLFTAVVPFDSSDSDDMSRLVTFTAVSDLSRKDAVKLKMVLDDGGCGC